MQGRVSVFKVNRIIAVKAKVVALSDWCFAVGSPRKDINVIWRQQKFHRHDEISIRAGKIVFRRIGQVIASKLRKNDFFFYATVQQL